MSTTTITPSGWTYVSSYAPTADYSGQSSPLTSYLFEYAARSDANWRNYGANFNVVATVLKFTRPNALKYARITSATLHWVTNGYIGYPDVTTYKTASPWSVATYTSSNELSNINWSNFRTGGVLGEFEKGGIVGVDENTPIARDLDVTHLYNGDLSAQSFMLVLCAGYDPESYQRAWIDTSNCYLTVEYEAGTQPAPTPLYPKDVTLIQTSNTLFSWQFNSQTEAVQTSAQLEYKLTSASNYTVLNLTQSGYSYTLNQSLPAGSYQWRIKVTNDAGQTSGYSDVAYFNIISKPASPIINAPANKTLTTISWNTSNQQACEIILADQNGKELYHETLATQDTIFKPNMFLKGQYLFSVRVMNDSSIWSDWGQRAFTISAAGPAAATLALAAAAETPAVHLTLTIPQNVEAVLVRSHEGQEKVLAKLEPFDTQYIDRTVAADQTYDYVIRTYVNGYTDSNAVQASVHFDGAILNTGDTSLLLDRSDEKFLPYSKEISRAFELMNFSGREYPMIERGEHTSVEFSRRFHVTYAQEKVLDRLSKEESVYYRDDKNHAYPAGLKRVRYDSYMDDGYLVTIDLVRLNEEEVLLNV